MPSERILALEPGDVCGLTDDLRGAQHATTRHGQQRRRERGDELLDLTLEVIHSANQVANGEGVLECETRDQAVDVGESGDDFIDALVAVQRLQRRIPGRVELVEMPPQSARQPGAFRHQVVAMIHQQPHLTRRTVETRCWQIWFLQRSASNRQRVDRVGLAVGASPGAGVRHHLRRHPHDRLTRGKQIAFQPARQMPAILDRPTPLRPELLRPTQHVEMISRGRRSRDLLARACGPSRRSQRPCGCACAHQSQVPTWSRYLSLGDKDRSVGTPQ